MSQLLLQAQAGMRRAGGREADALHNPLVIDLTAHMPLEVSFSGRTVEGD